MAKNKKTKKGLDGIPHLTAPKGGTSIAKETAKAAKVTQKDAKAVIDNYWREMVKSLKKAKAGEKITIPYIGTISKKEVKGRTYKIKGLDNTSKKSVTTKDHDAIKFTTSKKAIAFLNGEKGASIDREPVKKSGKAKSGKGKTSSKAKDTKAKDTSKSKSGKGKAKNKK